MKSLQERLAAMPGIRRLREQQRGYLQVLVPGFGLLKWGGARLIEIHVDDDTLSLTGRDGKRSLGGAVGDAAGGQARQALADQLDQFERSLDVLGQRFDCSAYPLRYANGGVLPVVHLNGVDYFCLFYRDVFPIGWNIANGASDNPDELLDPGRVIAREFGEELLVFDRGLKAIYAHDPGGDNRPPGFQTEALAAWARVEGMPPDLPAYKVRPLPLKWVEGPDQVDTTIRGRRQTTGGYFLSITPDDGAIEVDRFALIHLTGDVSIIDGEIAGGRLLNRIVGLFEVRTPDHWAADVEFLPDLHFVDGTRGDPTAFRADVDRTVRDLGPDVLSPAQRDQYAAAAGRQYRLCPITRRVIDHYFRWARDSRPAPGAPAGAAPVEVAPADGYDVFISHKSESADVARWLYEHLMAALPGRRVFCSGPSLGAVGESDYFREINRALATARCLVVFGTKPTHFSSGWIEYEWKTFLVELLSGRRPGGELFVFAEHLTGADLPFPLRTRELVPYRSATPHDTFDDLARRIKASLDRASG